VAVKWEARVARCDAAIPTWTASSSEINHVDNKSWRENRNVSKQAPFKLNAWRAHLISDLDVIPEYHLSDVDALARERAASLLPCYG
jgi:hypothetical protein